MINLNRKIGVFLCSEQIPLMTALNPEISNLSGKLSYSRDHQTNVHISGTSGHLDDCSESFNNLDLVHIVLRFILVF